LFEIVNSTATLWSDYHLRLESATNLAGGEPEDGIDPGFSGVIALNVFATTIFSGTNAEFFSGSLPPLASFVFESVVTESDQSIETYKIYGRPSYVPLPSTLALFALGLLAMRRRIAA
jgi:hypothetical protein